VNKVAKNPLRAPIPPKRMPRYAVERGDWREAAKPRVVCAHDAVSFAEANTFLARTLGAAQSGNAAATHADIAEITQRRDTLREAENEYWVTEVEVMRLMATAWTTLAEGRAEQALSDMRKAAEMEDKTKRHRHP
jgi:hypothetical protein